MPRLKQKYFDKGRDALKTEFGYRNDMMIPKLDKVVLIYGRGRSCEGFKKDRSAESELTRIAGQKAVITRARRSIAGSGCAKACRSGVKVTLRGDRMYEFLDRLVTVALPRVRDFRGLSPKSFDGRGNFAMGLREHIVFPEIDYDSVDETRGLDYRGLHYGE